MAFTYTAIPVNKYFSSKGMVEARKFEILILQAVACKLYVNTESKLSISSNENIVAFSCWNKYFASVNFNKMN